MSVQLQDFEKKWLARIKAGDAYHGSYMRRFHCKDLKEYYLGRQWAEGVQHPYVLNLFFSTIETQRPLIYFDQPRYTVSPSESLMMQDPEMGFDSVPRIQALLNTWVDDENTALDEAANDALLDAYFAFGILEVGVGTDWLTNPTAVPFPLKKDYKDTDKKPSIEGKVYSDEKVFVQNIPFQDFRTSAEGKKTLHGASWVGYWTYIRTDDLQAHPSVKNKDRFEQAGSQYQSLQLSAVPLDPTQDDWMKYLDESYTRVFKVWDNRRNRFHMFTDAGVLLFDTTFDIFPFVGFRFGTGQFGWYPMPPSYNWVHPQNEINDVRVATANHRKRFKRILAVNSGAVDRDELQAALDGPDGTVVAVSGSADQAFSTVPYPDLGSAHTISLNVTPDDFNLISGTTAEQRGQADRVTATQASIANERAQIRESAAKVLVAKMLVAVGRLVTKFSRNKLSQPLLLQTGQIIDPLYELGTDALDTLLTITVETRSPISDEVELNRFIKFLSLIQQFAQFALSPAIVQEMAHRCGYKNITVIEALQMMSLLTLLGQIEQAGAAQAAAQPDAEGTNAGNMAQQTLAPDTQSIETARSQLVDQGMNVGDQNAAQ